MQYLSLLELNILIKKTLSSQMAPTYWVVAEIGELRVVQKGHCYLELIEKEGNFLQAKLRATIWASNFRNINGWFEAATGQQLKPGMKVLANLAVEFHEQYGLSANIKDIDPKFTLGERARKRQEIIDKLNEDGVFEMNKMLTFPPVPQNIAVISSSSAAGYGDFVAQLARNEQKYKFHIDLYNATMQGAEAPASIVNALNKIYHKRGQYDLVAIVRGGGAQIDLDCFDDYDLANRIAQFPLPVITGIGHERDETIADLVAHTKLKTPTAVSAFLVAAMAAYEYKLDLFVKKLNNISGRFCQEQDRKLSDQLSFLKSQKNRVWKQQKLNLSQLRSRLLLQLNRNIKHNEEKIETVTSRLKSLSRERIYRENQKIDYLNKILTLSDPESLLGKGYTISYIGVKNLNQRAPEEGETLITRSKNYRIESTISKVAKNTNGKKEF